MKPSVGRIVHYQRREKTLAAIITEVIPLGTAHPNRGGFKDDDERGYAVSLCVFSNNGSFYKLDAPFSTEPEHKHWSWPPRVG